MNHIYRLILHQHNQRYALQSDDGSKYPHQSGYLTTDLLDRHLAGTITLGAMLLQDGNSVAKAGAIDIDCPRDAPTLTEALAIARRIQITAASLGLTVYLEFSGSRGFHVWLFVDQPLPGATMISALEDLAEAAGFQAKEIFPNHPITESKCIKLPCGINRKSGRRCGFLADNVVWDSSGFPILPEQELLLADFVQNRASAIATKTSTALQNNRKIASSQIKLKASDNPFACFSNDEHPACIQHLIQHGVPLDLEYNAANMTLARYAITRELIDAAALELASAMAKATPDNHPTSKNEAAKVSNFQSAWKSIKRNPERYQWSCSYALAGIETKDLTELATRGCIGNKCSVWQDFRTSYHFKPERDNNKTLLNQKIWLAIAALADRGAEVRLSTILAELETLDAPVGRAWVATNADELAEWELLAYILHYPETGLIEALLVNIPAAGFISVSESDTKSYLEALLKENPCSPTTFSAHLNRVRDTGLRVMATTQASESAAAFSDRRLPIPETLDRLLTQSRNLLRRTSTEIQPMEHHVPELLAELFSQPQNAIATPSSWLNITLNGGLLPGLLYVLAAPPGAGKTTFSSWLADFAATASVPVLYVAYEMSRNQLWAYALARLSGINSGLIESKRWMDCSYKEREDLAREVSVAAEKYAQQIAPYLTILEAGAEHTAARLKGAIAQVRHNAGLHQEAPVLCIIDYLQLMLSGDEKLDSANAETLRVSRVAISLKQLARETGAAVIAISDITKVAYQQAIATGSLDLSALRDSFKIAHAADAIMLLQTGKITVGKGDNAQSFDQLQLAAQKYSDKARLIEQSRLKYPLNQASKDTYARLSILKNRGGVLAEPLFVYEKALHRFKPIDLNLGETRDEESI